MGYKEKGVKGALVIHIVHAERGDFYSWSHDGGVCFALGNGGDCVLGIHLDSGKYILFLIIFDGMVQWARCRVLIHDSWSCWWGTYLRYCDIVAWASSRSWPAGIATEGNTDWITDKNRYLSGGVSRWRAVFSMIWRSSGDRPERRIPLTVRGRPFTASKTISVSTRVGSMCRRS